MRDELKMVLLVIALKRLCREWQNFPTMGRPDVLELAEDTTAVTLHVDHILLVAGIRRALVSFILFVP